MDRPRIALIVDHPLRDLGGLCLVAWELSRLGAQVYLVPFNWQAREVLALAPDLVVLNYLRPNNQAFVETLLTADIGYAMLDTEGGFYGDLSKYGEVMSRNSRHLKALRCMCVWGRKMYDYLATHPDLRPAQLVLTGLPRFDFYAPTLRKAALGLLAADWHGERPLFLINTKISIANSQFQSRAKEIEMYTKVLGVPRADVDRHIALGERAIEQICELATSLGARYADATVMIRPHPHERLQTYSERLAHAGAPQNAVVNRDGNVTPWILRSSVLIHRQCTTAVEAALAGTAAIAPQWVATSANAPDAEAVSHRCHSREELTELLNAACRGQLRPSPDSAVHLERIVDDWLFRVDGDSHRRAAAAILAATPERRVVDARRCRQLLYRLHKGQRGVAGRAYHMLNVLSSHIGGRGVLWAVEKYRRQFWVRAGKSFSADDVQKQLDLVRVALGPKAGFAAAARVPAEEYVDRYPGISVKVSAAT